MAPYSLKEPYVPWSIVVYYVGNRVPFTDVKVFVRFLRSLTLDANDHEI